MRQLWAPWRMTFIAGDRSGECIFCTKPRAGEEKDRENYIFVRRQLVFGMLNSFPYNSGHLMIAPYRHVTNLGELSGQEIEDLFGLLKDSMDALRKVMSPEGFNLGLNLGTAAGAGFEHLHLHVVPRWNGDTNFMPVLADTKVIPEHLEETYRRLREALDTGQNPVRE